MKLEKISKTRPPAPKRRYDDACAATHAIDIFGERWAVPVMRELMLGPRRFGDLKSSINGISANVLTQRLEGLEAAGVVLRRKLPPPASVQVYELTPWGYQAGPIFQAMGRWGARSPEHDPTRPFSAVSLVISFRTMLDSERAAGLSARFGFVLGEQRFLLALDDGAVTIGRDWESADVIFTGRPSAIAAVVYGGAPLDTLIADGALALEGDRALAERFTTLFPLPAKAPLPAPT